MIMARDIYNQQQALRHQKLAGKNSLEHLEIYWTRRLGISLSARLWRLYSVLHVRTQKVDCVASQHNVLDSTYKTNRYRIQFLHIIGVSPSNATFTNGIQFHANRTARKLRLGSSDFRSFFESSIDHAILEWSLLGAACSITNDLPTESSLIVYLVY